MSRRTFPRRFSDAGRFALEVARRKARILLLSVGLCAITACGGGEPVETGETGTNGAEPGPDVASPTSGEIPEGGLEDWVEVLRARLEVVELDPRASYPEVLRLYNTYHAAMERYYGADGEVTGDAHPGLAAAIQQQDSAFHELLELTGTTHYIERTHLLHAIRNVRLAMEEILDRARAAGVPLERTGSG